MSCPQNSKQEGELGTEIVTVFVQETSKRILKYYHVDSILKRIGGGGAMGAGLNAGACHIL